MASDTSQLIILGLAGFVLYRMASAGQLGDVAKKVATGAPLPLPAAPPPPATPAAIAAWAAAIGLNICVAELFVAENGGRLPTSIAELQGWGTRTGRWVNGNWSCTPSTGGGTPAPAPVPAPAPCDTSFIPGVRYVGQRADGQFIVVIGGQVVFVSADQGTAEREYNRQVCG